MGEIYKEIPKEEVLRFRKAMLRFEEYGLIKIIQMPEDTCDTDGLVIIEFTDKGLEYAKMLDPTFPIEKFFEPKPMH